MANNNEFEVDVRDVEYQNQSGKPWLARIYQPKGTGPFPSIVDVHGGAWHNGDRTNNAGIDQALAARGILVAAVDFRQPPEAGYPASICDVNLAVRWLKTHLEYWRTEEAMAEGSPQTIIERDEQIDLPPILMLLKANDRNHPLEMQERFIASYRKRGGAIEVQTFDGLPEHRMVPSPSQPETMRVIDTITAFIRRHTA